MTITIAERKVRIRQPKLYTYEDYARLTPTDSGNFELRNGQIIYMPSPTPNHQEICLNIATELRAYVRAKKLGRVIISPMDVTLTPTDTIQPDVLFVREDRLNIITDKRVVGAPDLVVEVLSEGNTQKEMNYKKFVYETAGVREYWFINPEKQTLTQYENIGQEFLRLQVLNAGDTLRSTTVEGFSLIVGEVFV